MSAQAAHYKSKTVATWIALVGGAAGLHRFYLHGFRDRWAWLFIVPSLVGLYGVQRMRHLGADDRLAWVLIPILGLTLSIAMMSAIVYGLTPDEKWNARFNRDRPQHTMNWATVTGVAIALIVGGSILMATIAFTAQRYFEYGTQATDGNTPALVLDAPCIRAAPIAPMFNRTEFRRAS
jgi:hypothetical protein